MSLYNIVVMYEECKIISLTNSKEHSIPQVGVAVASVHRQHSMNTHAVKPFQKPFCAWHNSSDLLFKVESWFIKSENHCPLLLSVGMNLIGHCSLLSTYTHIHHFKRNRQHPYAESAFMSFPSSHSLILMWLNHSRLGAT